MGIKVKKWRKIKKHQVKIRRTFSERALFNKEENIGVLGRKFGEEKNRGEMREKINENRMGRSMRVKELGIRFTIT